MQLNLSDDWYRRMAAKEDGCCISAGGWTFRANQGEAMKASEVVEGLRPVLENGIDNPTFRAAVQAAIALLTPEPVTEEGLRAEGFGDHPNMPVLRLLLPDQMELRKSIGIGRFVLITYCGEEIDLHIESMQQLREVIKALRGTTNESEAR